MTRVEEIVEQVRALPPDEQEVVRMLLSYDSEDFELSPEWQEEIRRRVAEVADGSATLRDWDEVERAYAEMKERKHRSQTA